MLLTQEKSLCSLNQKIIVSKDSGSKVCHRALNSDGVFCVRHYRLDGDVVQQKRCCDFLLINDTTQRAYFIELKGGNTEEALEQLDAGYHLMCNELQGYTAYFRLVCSRARTHNIHSLKFRRFKQKYSNRFVYKESIIEETLE